jgi:DNA-directed RNA polymerase specialized sigma24 family protein
MPRNPLVELGRQAERTEANYRTAHKAYVDLRNQRRSMMVECQSAGMTYAQVARIFGTTEQYVWRIITEARGK